MSLGFEMGPGKGGWKTNAEGMQRLVGAERIWVTKNATARYIRFLDDFPVMPLNNVWTDVSTGSFTADKTSGVAPLTVLTKPFPCPGKCVYCPTEPGMPGAWS